MKTVLQCDASLSGLGAYSRALAPTRTNYAQKEKKSLAIVFGDERFEGYVYGRKVLIGTDHKPMESIMKQNEAVHQSDCRKCYWVYRNLT